MWIWAFCTTSFMGVLIQESAFKSSYVCYFKSYVYYSMNTGVFQIPHYTPRNIYIGCVETEEKINNRNILILLEMGIMFYDKQHTLCR